ncbi:MAG TPA: phosphatase PAP2 family protein [Clostridia bacterium]|nr:phosphatase PAP2 family protein [Clostridia bacterium]
MKKNPNNQEIKPLPEVRIPGTLGRAAHWIAHIRPIYWLFIVVSALALCSIFSPRTIWAVLKEAIRAQKYLVVSLAIFSLLAISLIWKTGQRIDVWVFQYINNRGHRPPWLDGLMLGLTQIGNGVFAYLVAFVLYLRVKHLLAYELIFGNLTLWLTVELIKILIRRSRPYSMLDKTRVVGNRERGTSFPSGHTSQAFFMASLFAHYYYTGFCLTFLLYAIALFVGITRMYVGMHYPRDVLGGVILGSAWGILGMIINSYIFTQFNIH